MRYALPPGFKHVAGGKEWCARCRISKLLVVRRDLRNEETAPPTENLASADSVNARLSSAAGVAVLLASLSLYSVLRGSAWLFAAVGVVVIVAAAGIVARLPSRVPAVAAALLMLSTAVPLLLQPAWPDRLAGAAAVIFGVLTAISTRLAAARTAAIYSRPLLIYLNLVFTREARDSILGPSIGSLQMLCALGRRALADFAGAPPVQDSRAVSLFVAAGIAVVAIGVDVLAVGRRTPALAGLPLLLLFGAPIVSSCRGFGTGQAAAFAHAGKDGASAALGMRPLAASGRRGSRRHAWRCFWPPFCRARPGLGLLANPGNDYQAGVDVALQPLLQVQDQLALSRPVPVMMYRSSPDTQPSGQYLQVDVLNYNARRDNWLPVRAARTRIVSSRLPWSAEGVTGSVLSPS